MYRIAPRGEKERSESINVPHVETTSIRASMDAVSKPLGPNDLPFVAFVDRGLGTPEVCNLQSCSLEETSE